MIVAPEIYVRYEMAHRLEHLDDELRLAELSVARRARRRRRRARGGREAGARTLPAA